MQSATNLGGLVFGVGALDGVVRAEVILAAVQGFAVENTKHRR